MVRSVRAIRNFLYHDVQTSAQSPKVLEKDRVRGKATYLTVESVRVRAVLNTFLLLQAKPGLWFEATFRRSYVIL